MTDQIQSSPVGAPDSSSENTLAQWQELPLFLFRKRIKSLALLRYGDTSMRLSSPAVDYILSAQYSPTRHTSDGISPAVIIEETEMTYTAEPTSVPEPQRAVWEILAKSPSYEMRKTAAGRGLKVETFIELLSDRAFSVRETVLDNIDGLETLASTEGGRKALALALKDRTLRNTVRHRIRDIDERAAAVIRPLLIRAVTECDAVDGEPTPFELVLNPDSDPFTVVLTEPDALEATIDCLLDDDDFDDSYGKCVSGSFVVNADTSHIIEKLASDPREPVRMFAAQYARPSSPALRKLAFDVSPAVRRCVTSEPAGFTNEERIAFYGNDPERLIEYVDSLEELPATTDFIRSLLADSDPTVVLHATRKIEALIAQAIEDAEDFGDDDDEEDEDDFELERNGFDPDWDLDYRHLYGDSEEDDDNDEEEDEEDINKEVDARNLRLPLFDDKP